MIGNIVYKKRPALPPVDRRELLRYAGVREESRETEALLDSCIDEAEDKLSPRVCYREFEIKREGECLDLGFAKTRSSSLIKTLSDCDGIVLFCATVGSGMDRLIARYSLTSPSRSLIMQALGTERAEALCDAFCLELEGEKAAIGLSTTRRFSPGYGDLPLELQRDIFAFLDPAKTIGVSLGDNLLMSPSKSVTAIIGIKCKV